MQQAIPPQHQHEGQHAPSEPLAEGRGQHEPSAAESTRRARESEGQWDEEKREGMVVPSAGEVALCKSYAGAPHAATGAGQMSEEAEGT